MSTAKKAKFTIFEYDTLRIGHVYDDIVFTDDHHKQLENFFSDTNFPYYQLVRNGVRFCQYVGVVQAGNLIIEVLPKADRVYGTESENKHTWKQMLLDMLMAVQGFDVHAPSASALKLRSNSILALYFELFLREAEQLLHRGLIKRYRKVEGNCTAVKGSIFFAKNIRHNLVHQERVYTRHTTYDVVHPLNCVLLKTIRLLADINTNHALQSRINALLLQYPELPDIKVNEQWFSALQFTRKTEPYRRAIDIAKLLLLNCHPDLSTGRNNVLALMFNMNVLWEEFVSRSLSRNVTDGFTVHAQTRKHFWTRQTGRGVGMQPDIVIRHHGHEVAVLDTKWKNIGTANPSPDDLRQMYAYSKFHNNAITALIYPGQTSRHTIGNFLNETGSGPAQRCEVLTVEVMPNIKQWQQAISQYIFSRLPINPL